MVLIFNDIAGSEILLILVFILIFFGSKSIPTLARTLGKTIRQIKEASSDIQNEIKKSGADIKKDLNLTGIIQETAEDIKRPLDQMAVDLDNSVKYTPNSGVKSSVQLPPTTESLKEKATTSDKMDNNTEIETVSDKDKSNESEKPNANE